MQGSSGAVGVAEGGATGAAGAGEVTSSGHPERYSVGAPGVVRYRQSDATLPVPSGYTEESPSESGSKAWNLYECDGVVRKKRSKLPSTSKRTAPHRHEPEYRVVMSAFYHVADG
jgi:hypothetical protein